MTLLLVNVLGGITLTGLAALLLLTVVAELIAFPKRRADKRARQEVMLVVVEPVSVDDADEENVSEQEDVPAVQSLRPVPALSGVAA